MKKHGLIIVVYFLLSVFNTPEFHAWFDKAKVGDSYGYSARVDCNTCSGALIKTSDKSVRDTGIMHCTSMMCGLYGKEIQVR